ncbi:MAG: hypothetical protein Q9188_004455 [Gyalolechia gomerana]
MSLGIVGLSLEEGAEVDAADTSDKMALYLAAERGECDVLELLLAHNANTTARDSLGNTALHAASSDCDQEAVECLLKRGASPSAVSNNVATLLEYGATANKKRQLDGKTPLHLAAQSACDSDDCYGLRFSPAVAKLR